MKLFKNHRIKDQQKIDELSVDFRSTQGFGRTLRGLEKKWKKTNLWTDELWIGDSGPATRNISFLSIGKQTNISTRQGSCDISGLYILSNLDCNSSVFQIGMAQRSRKSRLLSLVDKQEVSGQLEEVVKDLSDSPKSTQLSPFYEAINVHLTTYTETKDEAFLWKAVEAFFVLNQTTKKEQKVRVYTLQFLKKKVVTGINRDLRLFFRQIIKFLFKNMEADEDSDALFTNCKTKTSFITLKLPYGIKKTYQGINRAY